MSKETFEAGTDYLTTTTRYYEHLEAKDPKRSKSKQADQLLRATIHSRKEASASAPANTPKQRNVDRRNISENTRRNPSRNAQMKEKALSCQMNHLRNIKQENLLSP
jgi:hypothetical protein